MIARRPAPALFLLALAVTLAPAMAQRRITIPAERFEQEQAQERARISLNQDANERDRLREMLLEWKQHVQGGNVADASDIVLQMKSLLDMEGIKDKRVLLTGLVAMGNEWAQTDSADTHDLADRAFKAALEIDPDFAPAHLGRAQLARERKPGVGGLLGMAGAVVQAVRARLQDDLGFAAALANAGYLLVAALAIVVTGVALVQLIKHARLFLHAVQEKLTDRVPDGVDRVFAWILVFLPVIAWLGPQWWVVYWLVLFTPYGTAGLRRLGIAVLVVAAFLPPMFRAVSHVSELQRDTVLRAATALDRRDVSEELLAEVDTLARARDVAAAWFLLARMQSAAGRPDDAISSYNSVISREAGEARAVVNRGNIHFRRNDLSAAIADYKLATDKDPQLALAWRNGSIANAQDLKADVASEWLSRAQNLDRKSVQEWADTVGPDRVVDADLGRGEMLGLVLRETGFSWRGLLLSFVNPLSIAALLGAVFVAVGVRRESALLEASACEKCGRAFCPKCHPTAKSSAYCQQCVHLYVKKDGVSPVVRTAKLREVERHLAIRAFAIRMFNLVLPGAGSLYANRLFVGTLVLLLWGAALAALLLSSRMVVDAGRLGSADLAVSFALQLALLVVVYLVALMQSLRHST